MTRRFPNPSLLLLTVCGCAGGSHGGVAGPQPRAAGPVPLPGEAVVATAPSLPVWEPDYGQRVRATVGTFPPFVGEVRAINGGVLLLQQGSHTDPLRLSSIRRMEVRRLRRTRALEGGVFGAVAGAVLGRVTLLGIEGDHWDSQGRLLAPGLGAIMGGLLGSLIGWKAGGDYWEEVTVPASVSLTPRRVVEGAGRSRGTVPGPRRAGPAANGGRRP